MNDLFKNLVNNLSDSRLEILVSIITVLLSVVTKSLISFFSKNTSQINHIDISIRTGAGHLKKIKHIENMDTDELIKKIIEKHDNSKHI